MQSRNGISQNNEPVFSKADFDEASAALKLNKKSIGNWCYKYKCIKIAKNGKVCKNESLYNCNYCRFHINCKNIENQTL